ncbi:hypothetical protein ACTXT7_004721 [Hymenolepis weldensis]
MHMNPNFPVSHFQNFGPIKLNRVKYLKACRTWLPLADASTCVKSRKMSTEMEILVTYSSKAHNLLIMSQFQ